MKGPSLAEGVPEAAKGGALSSSPGTTGIRRSAGTPSKGRDWGEKGSVELVMPEKRGPIVSAKKEEGRGRCYRV